MRVVGVTGKYCAGKDTAVRILVSHGFIEINMDRIGHEALQAERERIVERFGPKVLDDEGQVDRRALGRIVFASKRELRALEAILHPDMVEEAGHRVERLRREGSAPGAVMNAALLSRMGLDRLCDVVIYVDTSFCKRLRRARRRDDAGLLEVLRRLRSQRDVAPQFLAPNADVHSVQNDGSQEQLRAKLESLLSLP